MTLTPERERELAGIAKAMVTATLAGDTTTIGQLLNDAPTVADRGYIHGLLLLYLQSTLGILAAATDRQPDTCWAAIATMITEHEETQ